MVKTAQPKPYRWTIRCDECREVVPAFEPKRGLDEWIVVRCPLCGMEATYAPFEVRAAVLSHLLGPKLVRTEEVA